MFHPAAGFANFHFCIIIPMMLLTIDVGNTTTGIAIFEDEKIVTKNKLMTPNEVSENFLKSLIKKEFRKRITRVVVSSVVPFIDRSLQTSVIALFGRKALFIDHKTDTGLAIKIDIPNELGADRIADSVGALHFFDPPLIIIDSGTATTFDIISREFEYLGGAIFPGIELSINSLARNTAKLERITFGVPDSILGTNTDTSIRAGIFYSYLGGLAYMIDQYKKLLGGSAKVVATGGLSRYFKDHLDGIDLYEPDLIYYGLRKIHNRAES